MGLMVTSTVRVSPLLYEAIPPGGVREQYADGYQDELDHGRGYLPKTLMVRDESDGKLSHFLRSVGREVSSVRRRWPRPKPKQTQMQTPTPPTPAKKDAHTSHTQTHTHTHTHAIVPRRKGAPQAGCSLASCMVCRISSLQT